MKNYINQPGHEIPDFTIGHPVFGDDNVTYLEFNDAYQNQQR